MRAIVTLQANLLLYRSVRDDELERFPDQRTLPFTSEVVVTGALKVMTLSGVKLLFVPIEFEGRTAYLLAQNMCKEAQELGRHWGIAYERGTNPEHFQNLIQELWTPAVPPLDGTTRQLFVTQRPMSAYLPLTRTVLLPEPPDLPIRSKVVIVGPPEIRRLRDLYKLAVPFEREGGRIRYILLDQVVARHDPRCEEWGLLFKRNDPREAHVRTELVHAWRKHTRADLTKVPPSDKLVLLPYRRR